MKPPVFIEICDFERFPTGGQLTFARNLLAAWGPELALVGCDAGDRGGTTGEWTEKTIDGRTFKFFPLGRVRHPERKSLIPRRAWGLLRMLRNRKNLRLDEYSDIVISAPEILFTLPSGVLGRTTIILPGLENPLRISRYFYGKWFAAIYDRLLYRRLGKLKKILAAADRPEIARFAAASRGRLTADRITMFPTCYPENVFHLQDRAAVRRRLGIPEDIAMVVTVGRIGRYKGWRFMLESFAGFAERRPDSRFYLIGEGEDSAELAAAAAGSRFSGRVFPAGRRSPAEVADFLAAADMFIMGSYKEGWCTALVEAVACGARCCVTDFSSAAEMVKNGVNGFVVPGRDERIFAEKMVETMELPAEGIKTAAENIREYSLSGLKQKLASVMERPLE
ncbi:MAG: glycosyltransferase family 4 protein [Victivallaceae bacterium]|nr:glycosyltransferase family 4 protein [Victivallaceae bacterium]